MTRNATLAHRHTSTRRRLLATSREPGSPGAGMVYLRHNFVPVSGSHPSRNPRVVDSPPDIPEIKTPLATIGAPVA